ncbi:MAG TPA: phage tail protein [Deltaproteobacteria bacterium]|nr:phage tail protein [Deltaproteobacteria bacterium]
MALRDYRNLISQLFPSGDAWNQNEGSTWKKLIHAFADEFFRIDRRAQDLLNEADPRTTYEMLEDWERCVGLPDECTGLANTLEERRDQVVAKLVKRGNQSIQFFKELAAPLGYAIEIEEYDQFHVGDRVGGRLYGVEWMHAFGAIAPLQSLRPFRVNSYTVEERLVEFGDEALECLITKAKPSHSVVLFIYQ